MKAQELRIGNWVKDHGETGQQWPVSSINQNGFTAGPMEVFPAGMMHDWGIPLTAEWLEGFGFKFNEHWDSWKNNGIEISMDPNEGFFEEIDNGVKLKHVHQLQNLFYALSGQELELTKA